ncbi:PREDICTED: protein white-like, partial [Rhagoletis zephyria]|uniref:protein white-like n=1 Tax=Rhagoletis zephyria TaxID=28612 RepID=UPI0008116740
MGSSGAGKTTLLNVLTARNLSNFAVEGCVKINGQTADVDMITSVSAYVQQQDLFLATLTVREHLVFQAMLRMNAAISPREKADRIVEVMRELSLEKCADTIVGGTMSTGKGISGGELKRLAFAVEILTNPSIMFCDEPTSGLDAFMAANLVEYLNKMASKGRTIICTIHQPSTDVFNLFENLLLMADGQVAYMGNTQQALEYFKSCGLPCPLNYNPADFYVQELAVIPGKEEACHEKIDKICSYHRKLHPMSGEAQQQQTTFVQKTVTTSYKIVATILGIFFWGQELNERGVMNINGALFIYLLNLSMQNAFAVVNVFCSELPVFLREYGSGMYRPDSYYVTKNLAEMPIFVLLPIFVGCINYYMIGFNKDVDAFLYLIVVGIVISSIGVSY